MIIKNVKVVEDGDDELCDMMFLSRAIQNITVIDLYNNEIIEQANNCSSKKINIGNKTANNSGNLCFSTNKKSYIDSKKNIAFKNNKTNIATKYAKNNRKRMKKKLIV